MTVFSLDRRWRGGGGFRGPIEGLPELIAACDGKEDNFASMVKEVLQPHQISQVGRLSRPRFKANRHLLHFSSRTYVCETREWR